MLNQLLEILNSYLTELVPAIILWLIIFKETKNIHLQNTGIPGQVVGQRCNNHKHAGGQNPRSAFFVQMSGPMEKILMTRAGYTALNDELKKLKSVERPAIIQAIAEARELGDLSENAEYHSAREKQSFIEGRIKELEGVLSLTDVIDPKTLSGAVKFSATVTIVDEDTDEEKTYQIVGEHEADIERGLLNIKSPLARALIGKDEGDSVEVRTPGGEKAYEILKIAYI